MVHVENSLGYQTGVMELFRVIAEFIGQFEDEFGNQLWADVSKSAEFMAYITKPNGLVAEIGDTNSLLSVIDTGNRYRDYFVSSHAHNTVIVDSKTYSPTVENSSKTGIYQWN